MQKLPGQPPGILAEKVVPLAPWKEEGTYEEDTYLKGHWNGVEEDPAALCWENTLRQSKTEKGALDI